MYMNNEVDVVLLKVQFGPTWGQSQARPIKFQVKSDQIGPQYLNSQVGPDWAKLDQTAKSMEVDSN